MKVSCKQHSWQFGILSLCQHNQSKIQDFVKIWVLLWEVDFLMRMSRGFFAQFSSASQLILFSASSTCWAWILAAFSLRISSRVFTLTSPRFKASESGPAVSHSPWLFPGASSAAYFAFSSSCLFFLAWRISENVLTWLTAWSFTVMVRLTPLMDLLLLICGASTWGPSLDREQVFAAFSCRISSRVLMRICSGAFFDSVLDSAVINVGGHCKQCLNQCAWLIYFQTSMSTFLPGWVAPDPADNPSRSLIGFKAAKGNRHFVNSRL